LFAIVLDVHTNVWLIRLLVFCSGSCIGWLGLAVQTAAFSTISSADTGRAAALFQTQTQAAGGIGVAVLVTVVSLAPHGTAGAALVPDFHHAYLTAMGFIIAAGLVALTIRDSDAANSMKARIRGRAAAGAAAEAGAEAELAAAGPAPPSGGIAGLDGTAGSAPAEPDPGAAGGPGACPS
jgi:hypothetical protein